MNQYSLWGVLVVVVGLMGWMWEHNSETRRDVENLKAARAWEKTFVNGIGQRMIWVPAGSFRMGDLVGNGDPDEQNVRTVELSGYHLAATEVTRAQWNALLDVESEDKGNGKMPADNVSWEKAMEFCEKLTQVERDAGRLPEGYRYILPTEAQWENACRAGSEGNYGGTLNELAWFGDNSEGRAHQVATRRPNSWGFHDMHGNMWEWCREWYAEAYDENDVRDPQGPADGSNCIVRGGSWGARAPLCRASNRSRSAPAQQNQFFGFRPCLVPISPGGAK